MKLKNRFSAGTLAALKSNRIFWIIFGVFLLAALWMALSGAYSMAFDEYVHYGIIKIYSEHWLPFLSTQPASADAFGAVTRDPSYLYHYLMSFPFRVFAHFVHGFMAQIIFLRLFSIAFFAGGLLMFRALFRKAGASQLVTNLAMGFFMLLPVTPFVAAQVNYDNLLFLMTGLSLWLALNIYQKIRRGKAIPAILCVWFVTVVLLAAQVKYAYLPIALALAIFFVVLLVKRFGWSFGSFIRAFRLGMAGVKRWQLILAGLVLVAALGLFTARYGVNVVRYHTPTPECNQAMDLERCMAYEPFARNYQYVQGNYDLPVAKIAAYPFNNWTRGMLRSLFFVVANKESGYVAGEPLPFGHVLGYTVIAGGAILVITRLKWLWRQGPANRLFISVTGVYVVLLFTQNFMDFLNTHVPVAIQGRYLLPVLPLLLVLVAQAAIDLFRRFKPRVGLIALALLCFMILQSGNLVPFITRQHDNWLWNAPVVRQVNHAAKDVISPLVIGA